MAIIKVKKIKVPLRINPYLTLGILKGASPAQTKAKFREKMKDARNDDELRAKICLAYDVIVNNSLYKKSKEGDDIYEINDNLRCIDLDAYYYTVIGDTLNLIKEIENNYIHLDFKDPLKRNLLYIAARIILVIYQKMKPGQKK